MSVPRKHGQDCILVSEDILSTDPGSKFGLLGMHNCYLATNLSLQVRLGIVDPCCTPINCLPPSDGPQRQIYCLRHQKKTLLIECTIHLPVPPLHAHRLPIIQLIPLPRQLEVLLPDIPLLKRPALLRPIPRPIQPQGLLLVQRVRLPIEPLVPYGRRRREGERPGDDREDEGQPEGKEGVRVEKAAVRPGDGGEVGGDATGFDELRGGAREGAAAEEGHVVGWLSRALVWVVVVMGLALGRHKELEVIVGFAGERMPKTKPASNVIIV